MRQLARSLSSLCATLTLVWHFFGHISKNYFKGSLKDLSKFGDFCGINKYIIKKISFISRELPLVL